MADRLECIALSKYYGKKHVVKDVTFSMESGEITGLLGPNGAGKTTSFYMIVGFIKANGGKILLSGEDITHLAMHERSRKGLAYLPQEASIFRKLTVEDNIRLILEAQKISKEERKRRLEDLLYRFGIERVRKQYGYTLSGGERRRTEIARALATSPKFLLLDEPFAGIDYAYATGAFYYAPILSGKIYLIGPYRDGSCLDTCLSCKNNALHPVFQPYLALSSGECYLIRINGKDEC